MNYRYSLLMLLLVMMPWILRGQSYTEKRIFRKTFPVNRDMTFELNNKYGTVRLTTWNYDSVAVRTEVEASSSDQERLRKMFNGIDVKISSTSFLVRAETEFTQNINLIFETFKGLTNKLIPYESRIQINYYVNAPEYLDMRITNKYGDVWMENNTGKFSLNLSNGSFEANSLNNASDITLTFCDASVRKINKGSLNTSFSEIVIDETPELSLSSVSSRFDIGKAGRLDVQSRRDKFFIESAGSLSGDSYFTSFRIDELGKEINLETNYGSIGVDRVLRNLEIISLNSSYTDIELKLDQDVSYNLDIRHLHTFLVLPDENLKVEKRTLNEDKSEYITSGTVGPGQGKTKIIINSTRGNIYLK